VSTLAPLSYTQLLWMTIAGFVAFGALPDGWTIVGAAIIVGSGLYTAWRERHPLRPAGPGDRAVSSSGYGTSPRIKWNDH
jgi:drug/metabolite transporter (DMT)-like permease